MIRSDSPPTSPSAAAACSGGGAHAKSSVVALWLVLLLPIAAAPAAEWKVLLADSTANVLRDGSISSSGAPAATAQAKPRLSVAHNEFEGVQLVVAAGSAAVTGLRWAAALTADGGSPPLDITIAPVGYVHAGLSQGCPWNVTGNSKCSTSKPIDCGDGVCKARSKLCVFLCTNSSL
jgi:hypothetical protein